MSWYQDRPDLSLEFVQETQADPNAAIIDVGAGASTLVDHLLADGYSDITLLDISGQRWTWQEHASVANLPNLAGL